MASSPDSAPETRESGEPSKVSKAGETLYEQIKTAYTWMPVPKTKVMSKDEKEDVRAYNASRKNAHFYWEKNWKKFKQQDRELALDLLLSAYCTWRKEGGRFPQKILYKEMVAHIEEVRKGQLVPTSHTRTKNIMSNLKNLIKLYYSPGFEAALDQALEQSRVIELCRERLTHAKESDPKIQPELHPAAAMGGGFHPTIEVFFATLSLGRQQELVHGVRQFLFDTCSAHANSAHAKKDDLPQAYIITTELDWAMNPPVGNLAMIRFNECINVLGATVQFCAEQAAESQSPFEAWSDILRPAIRLLDPKHLQQWQMDFVMAPEEYQKAYIESAAKILHKTKSYFAEHRQLPNIVRLLSIYTEFIKVMPPDIVNAAHQVLQEEHAQHNLQSLGHTAAHPFQRTQVWELAQDDGNWAGPGQAGSPYVPQARKLFQWE